MQLEQREFGPKTIFIRTRHKLTFLAQNTIGEAQLPRPLVRVPSAVSGKQFVFPCRDRRRRAVVRKTTAAAPEYIRHRSKYVLDGSKEVAQGVEKLAVDNGNGSVCEEEEVEDGGH